MSKKFLSPIKLAQGATNPAVGSEGELFWNTVDLKVYVHNGTSWAASGGAFTMSPTAPTSPEPKHGDPWLDTSDGSLYVRYVDVDGTGQWIQIQTTSAINSELVTRAQALESDVAILQTQTAGFEADVISLDSRTDSLEARATAVEGRATALEYGYNSPNYVLNAAMEINQRAFTSSTNVTGVYTFDRWRVTLNGATVTTSAQSFTTSDSLALSYGARNYLRIVTSGQSAASNYARLTQAIENVQTLAGKQVTVSFWAKAASGTPKVGINFENNYNTSSWLRGTAQTVTLNTAWTRYSVTMNVPAITGYSLDAPNTTSNLLEFWVSAGTEQAVNSGGVGLQANTFDFWGIQVEANPVATPFRRNAPSIQAELAACQRYCYVKNGSTTDSMWGWGRWEGNNFYCVLQHPVPMRTAPSVISLTSWNGLQVVDPTAAWYNTTGSINMHKNGTTAMDLWFGVASASVTNRTYGILAVNSGNPQLIVSAEL